ncbi:TerD family protein, partial [Frankia canadensis]|uniref:TerD family protein n=1 Tax=Frankia canadensis TaxID=1836972 RepID=UPI0014028992
MTRTLPKGGNLALADAVPGSQAVTVALGWDDGPALGDADLDTVVILTGAALSSAPPSPRLLLAQQVPNPDERPAAAPRRRPLSGDADRLVVTPGAVPPDVERLLIGAALVDPTGARPTFRRVRGAYIRLLSADGTEVVHCPVDAETGRETFMIFGELYRHPRGWKFRAVGQGYTDGLPGLLAGRATRHVPATANGTGGGGGPIAPQGAAGQGRLVLAQPTDVVDFLARSSPTRTRRTIAAHLRPQPPASPHPGRAPASTAAPTPPPSPAPTSRSARSTSSP